MSKKIYIISVTLLIILGLSYNEITDIDHVVKKEASVTKVAQKVTREDIEEVKKRKLEEQNNEKIEIKPKILTKNEDITENINPESGEGVEIEIKKLIYSSNIVNLIEINGTKKSRVKNIDMGNNSFNIKEFQGKTFIEIPEYSIDSGKYNIVFHLENGERIDYDKKILFWESEQKNLFISNITPNKIKSNSGNKIVLQGQGFDKVISIQLSNNLVLTRTNFEIINDNVMILSIPEGLKVGSYSMNVMSPNGIYKSELGIQIN